MGKTTCAAAAAVGAALGGERVLLASTDPAHSLGDALELDLGPRPRAVPAVAGLAAVEIDAEAAWDSWLAPRRELLATIAERGTWLRRGDVLPLLGLRVPGVDELLGLLEVLRQGQAEGVDLVVVDTAPTGHTLRLLEMPQSLERLAAVLDALDERHRALAEAFGGGHRPGAAEVAIDEIRREAQRLDQILRDTERATLAWVLLPEPLALAETERTLLTLERRGLGVSELIVNRLARADDACARALGRLAAELEALADVRRRLPGRRVAVVREAEREPLGIAALRPIAAELLRRAVDDLPHGEAAPVTRAQVPGTTRLPAVVDPGVELVAVGGKGGVGKSTCAAALALAWARRWPGRRVDLVSTDPAHSLGLLFGFEAQRSEPSSPRGGPRNLTLEEIDAGARFERLREHLLDALSRFVRAGDDRQGGELPLERAVFESLLEATPPGLDELMAIDVLAERLARDEPPLVVLDTAPTGHALRLLEMPELALRWVHALMRILLDYRETLGLGQLATTLLELAHSLERVRRLLADGRQTAFVVVTRPAALPCRETERLLGALDRLGIGVPAIVVNAVTPPGVAPCRAERAAEARWVERLRREAARRGCAILVAPLRHPRPMGIEGLPAWLAEWTAVEERRADEGASP